MKKIINGVSNSLKFFFLSKDKKNEIKRRRLICSKCEFNSKNVDIKTYRLDVHCILCSCNIKLKTASLISNCGMETFNTKNMPLKWFAYSKSKFKK